MSDKDNEALNNTAEEEVSQSDTPSDETKATEKEVVEKETTPEPDTLTDQKPEPSKGANKRIRELNAQKKQAEERAQSLEDRMRELTEQVKYPSQVPQASINQPTQPLVQPGEEISVEELDRRVQEREARIYQNIEARTGLQIEQSKVLDNIQKESSEVMALYPELNPDIKESFDKDLSDSIVEASLAYVKSNPSGSVKQFVTRLMKPYQKSIKRQISDKTGQIAKQVAETAARPNQVTKDEKPFSELSIEEMEAKLGTVN